jgi:hypothetical protein
MKNSIFTLTSALIISIGILFSGCQSAAQKEQIAQDKVEDAQNDLNAAQTNANAVQQKAATVEELKIFRLESELKMKNNEVSIAEIKLRMNKPGSALDEVYAKKIDSLELSNQNLKSRIDTYEKSQSDWETFKREFNRDMDELGNKLKSMAAKNKQK